MCSGTKKAYQTTFMIHILTALCNSAKNALETPLNIKLLNKSKHREIFSKIKTSLQNKLKNPAAIQFPHKRPVYFEKWNKFRN